MTILFFAGLILHTGVLNSETVAQQDSLDEPGCAELSMELVRAVRDGKSTGAIQMLNEYNIIPENSDSSISFKEYDWTPELENYEDI